MTIAEIENALLSNQCVISWPNSVLNPNNKSHWAKKARAKKAQRAEAFWAAASRRIKAPESGDIYVHMTFFPPTKQRRDRDNLIASMKSALDGLADAMGADDSRFNPSVSIADVVKGGAVVIEVSGKPIGAVSVPFRGAVS